MRIAEQQTEVFVEGIEEDFFGGERMEVVLIEFAAALSESDADPVGSAVAGAVEAVGLDKGFQQNGLITVAGEPIGGQLTGCGGENAGGQIGGADPGKDQEAGVVDHQVEVLLALRWRPTDPLVAWSDLPSGGGEAEGCQ